MIVPKISASHLRAVYGGILVWILVSAAFTLLGQAPGIEDPIDQQGLIIGLLIIPFAILAAAIYYRRGNRDHGLKVGGIMVLTAFALDAAITVPLVEIPKGGSYVAFYSAPVLWLFALVNIATVYLFWRLKIRRAPQSD